MNGSTKSSSPTTPSPTAERFSTPAITISPTPLLSPLRGDRRRYLRSGRMSASHPSRVVAAWVVRAIEGRTFPVLPHPEVPTMYRQKAAGYERWIAGMRRYQRNLGERGVSGPRTAAHRCPRTRISDPCRESTAERRALMSPLPASERLPHSTRGPRAGAVA